MNIKFDEFKLLENIQIGKISFISVVYEPDYFGMEDRYHAMESHTVYYDALRNLFFTKEVYSSFRKLEDLIKFYRDYVGDVRSYRDVENDIFHQDIICL
ncbi:hypothetical protein [Aeromonas phage AS-yj]|uniref:Uncharacterized protein n=5 Tax=Caudoviricetes TaxID=2731619 RepID=A0A291LDY7_9CAUD|nr:hypothetical protein HWB28_gp174 [Aeromonas phage AS-zj]ATI17618.1 hypothetical protein [Aeromonas phage AS-szw]ATI17889.1 hypothetical protein [Aeromonas phage AS-yj]QAX97652.1 hypothetical protein ASswx1_6 [Aeromonas phage Asswx_1]QAX98900.1 hypothetical protein assk_103 [Aeromonas phage Assk]QMV29063.1 hypothetical protein AP1_0356 [Aeromonas phage AP1]UKM62687.1 hypothetical protein P19_0199 [Aeromonas phage P19]